jgi:NTE family protein
MARAGNAAPCKELEMHCSPTDGVRTAGLAAAATLLLGLAGATAASAPGPGQGTFSSQSVPVTPQAAGTSAPGRPRVGLVLAGGGAKGGAHVGVLKVLEELNVPIDCIAGTSMGALVAGGYASGIPAKDLETFMLGIDWPKVVGGVGLRENEPIEQKRAGVTYSNNVDMGFRDGHVVVPGGLVNTAGIDDLLRSYVAKARGVDDFDQLPIPYRAVATDMVSGQMVVLDRGDLATAMRASMAIPGAFAPVHVQNYILNDGGMVRNLPIDVARNLCADVVIAVNLVKQPTTPDKLQTATQLAGRAMDVMLEANVELQLQTLKPGDIRVDVQVGDIGTADFTRVPETIPLGEKAARAVADQLRQYSVPAPEYTAWRQRVTSSQKIEAQLADVRFEGLKWVNPAYLGTLTDVRPGEQVDSQRISEQARAMSAVQDLETVGYRLEGDRAKPTLTWLPKEKTWGPNFVQFDLGLYASEGGDNGFMIYAKQERRWLNSLGLQWRNEIQLGYSNLLASSLYQPLDVAQRFFVEPQAFLTQTWEYIYYQGDRIAEYEFDDLGGQLDLGVNFGHKAQLRTGYLYTSRKVRLDTGPNLFPEVDTADAGIVAEAIYDSRDAAFTPTRGIAAAVEYMDSNQSLGADRDWQRIEAGIRVALPVRGDVVWLAAAGGSNLGGELPVDRFFTIGGPGSFPGLQLAEYRAPEYWTVSGSYLWKLADLETLRGEAIYLGAQLETGEIANWASSLSIPRVQSLAGTTPDQAIDPDLRPIYGGALYFTGRTPVGPLTLGVGATSTSAWSVWLSVGRPIGQGTILERGIFR